MKKRAYFKLALALACGTASLALLAPQEAGAQDEAVELTPILVEGERTAGIDPVRGVVARETRTGIKSATEIREIPQSVTVMGREEIDSRAAQKVDEALRYAPGVFSQPFGADSDTDWMYVRGFNATQRGAYLDGLQLFGHGFGAFFLDSFTLERIEVLRGPASVLYGGSNPGGIINAVTRRPAFARTRYAEIGVNDAGTAHLGFDFGDALSDQVAYRLTGRIAGGDNYSDDQDGWRGVVAPSVTWRPNAQASLSLLANYTHIDETHGGGTFLPYEGTVVNRHFGGVNYGRIDTDANFSEPSVDSYDRRQGSLGTELDYAFDNGLTLRSIARFGIANVEETQVYANGWASARELDRIHWNHDTTATTFLIDNQAEARIETGAIEHSLLAGVDYKYYHIDHEQSSALFGTTPPIDAFNPVHGAALTDPVSYLNQDLYQQQLGLYLQDQIRFGGGWLVTLTGRYDWGWLETDDHATFYAPDQDLTESKTHGKFSGRAGLAYSFDNGITPYVSVATFFNPLIGTDANGDMFKPEEGIQYEAGVKWAPSFIDGLFTVSLFDLTRENVPSNVTPFTQLQTGEVRSRGIELEGRVNVTESFRVIGALTAYDIDITEDENPALEDNTPFLVPEFLASAWADYTFRGNGWYDGIVIGGGVRHYGSSWADNENTLKVPSATLADARIGYDWGGWGVDLNVTNLFDKEYVVGCQTTITCSYGEGRSFKLRAHVSW